MRGDAVSFAINNAKAAGIGHLLRFDKRDVRDFQPPDGPPGVILCNPPYGERIGEERELARPVSRCWARCSRSAAGLDGAASSPATRTWPRASGLKPVEQIPLYNGKIPCRLLKFDGGS